MSLPCLASIWINELTTLFSLYLGVVHGVVKGFVGTFLMELTAAAMYHQVIV